MLSTDFTAYHPETGEITMTGFFTYRNDAEREQLLALHRQHPDHAIIPVKSDPKVHMVDVLTKTLKPRN